MQAFVEYLATLRRNLAQGDSTEHTHRAALQRLIEQIAPNVTVINEAQRISCGAPDLTVRLGTTPLGHVETKDIGVPLDEVEKGKGPHGKQFKRYLSGLPNWILTDYLRFDWFVAGELRRPSVVLAKLDEDGKILPVPGGAEAVEHLVLSLLEPDLHTVETAPDLAKRMAGITHLLRDAINDTFLSGSSSVIDWLNYWLASFRATLVPELKQSEFSDMFAQTLAYGLFAARIQTSRTGQTFSHAEALLAVPRSNPFLRKLFYDMAGAELPSAFRWAVDDLVRLLQVSDVAAILADFGKSSGHEDPIFHFYETFLSAYDPKLREKRGVYYTPEPIVRYMVRSVDWILRSRFKKPRGLADEKTLILDPAAGTATFLYHVIEQIKQKMKGQEGTWPSYVRDHLLNRLFGFELLMAPYSVANLKLGLELEQTGYKFSDDERLGIYLTNTLEEAIKQSESFVAKTISEEANTAVDIKRDKKILVVLGNPPYKGISANANERVRQVEPGGTYWSYHSGAQKGQSRRVQKTARKRMQVKEPTFIGELMDTYKWIGDARIKDKKSWLNNDYAKFIRFSQWRLERSGEGVLAFITDNSYLDKSSFRGMRWNLMNVFDELYIYNLHGRSKPPEATPNSIKDENVFDIQQGVAILIAIRSPAGASEHKVFYADLWGDRLYKYMVLDAANYTSTVWQELKPQAPHYLFEPSGPEADTDASLEELRQEYSASPSMTDIFKVKSSGFTTARDYFIMSTNKGELQERIADLVSPENSDEYLRQKYFAGRGAEQYLNGDSRSWKLPEARKKLRADRERDQRYKVALYRPFNFWQVFWTDYMVDWPRADVMTQMERPNLAIIYSRNVETPNAEHFFCTETIAGHHSASIKEVNYLAPLYLYDVASSDNTEMFDAKRPNFNQDFLRSIAQNLQLRQEGEYGLPENISPEDIFGYIYAIVHSHRYRTRYAEFLKRDFPRIPLTKNLKLFQSLSSLGNELVTAHLLKSDEAPQLESFFSSFPISGTNKVTRVYYDPAKCFIRINDSQYFAGVPENIWNFQIGGYRVCERWLKDRRDQHLDYIDIQHLQRVMVALSETSRLMVKVDDLIPGWPLK